MGELLLHSNNSITHKIEDHWEQYRDQCRTGLELAEQNLARIALQTSGQLEIDYEQTEIVPHLPESA